MPLLEIKNLRAGYSGLEVLHDIGISIEDGATVALLGNNGAGKTTTLKSIAGLVKPNSGKIIFDGKEIQLIDAHQLSRIGITLVPEGRRLFPEHTVKENLELGAINILKQRRVREFEETLDYIFELFPRVKERLNQRAGLLSGGEQQMVAIARALVNKPKLLLLDEPSLGLAPIAVNQIFEAFQILKENGLTILLVEQMAWKALELADYAYVLESGKIFMSGPAKEMISNKQIIDAYLGDSS